MGSVCTVNALKISNTIIFPISKKMLVFMTVIYKMLVRIANSSDPDQIASEEAV